MTDAPKIVKDRLRAAAPRDPHPEADMLTAFAEQALSGAEREGVVRHLARCGDCREVVALSLPPSVEVVKPVVAGDKTSVRTPADRSRAWFAWPNLRWAAMAAGVVVVASVLILRPGKQTDSTLGTENLAAQGNAQAPATDAKPSSVAPSAPQLTRSYSNAPSTKPDNALALERRASRRDEQPLGRVQTRAAAPPAYLADNKRVDSLQDKSSLSFGAGKRGVQSPAPSIADFKGEVVAAGQGDASAEKMAVVAGAANEVQSAPAEGGLMAKNDAPALPIEKAKPAVKEKEEVRLKSQVQESEPQKKLAPAYVQAGSALARQKKVSKQSEAVAVPHWMLGQGKLQRSLDEGKTWLTTPQLDRYVLTFGVLDREVWAGSQGGTLFHSTDAGVTWTTLQPATKSATLTADIVDLRVRSRAEIVLTTKNGETWTTTDAGKSWDKK